MGGHIYKENQNLAISKSGKSQNKTFEQNWQCGKKLNDDLVINQAEEMIYKVLSKNIFGIEKSLVLAG